MARRPESHIIGDVAVNQIRTHLIPQGWVVNEHSRDYGPDLHVQVCVDYCSTSNCFYIQSKGTESASNNGEISYEMPVDRLLDYKNIPLPVLIVYYSLTDDIFWGIWANGIYDTLTDQQKEQNSYSIRFTRNNIIDVAYLESIGLHIQKEYTNRIDFRTENTQPDLLRLHQQLFKLLEKTFSNQFSLHNRLACHVVNATYTKEESGLSLCV